MFLTQSLEYFEKFISNDPIISISQLNPVSAFTKKQNVEVYH